VSNNYSVQYQLPIGLPTWWTPWWTVTDGNGVTPIRRWVTLNGRARPKHSGGHCDNFI